MKKLLAIVAALLLVFPLAHAEDTMPFVEFFNIYTVLTGAPEIESEEAMPVSIEEKPGQMYNAGPLRIIIADDYSEADIIGNEKDVTQILQLSATAYFALLKYSGYDPYESIKMFYYVLLTDFFDSEAGHDVHVYSQPGLFACFLVKSNEKYIFRITINSSRR